MLTPTRQLPDVPQSDWPLPSTVTTITLSSADAQFLEAGEFECSIPDDVILAHSIRQRTELLAQSSDAALAAELKAAGLSTLPSGAGYNSLGLKFEGMDANAVRRYAETKWPHAFQSPLAQVIHAGTSMAQLEASDADAVIELAELRKEATEMAESLLLARDGWTVETLSHNIESVFGLDLGIDECDEIARSVLNRKDPK